MGLREMLDGLARTTMTDFRSGDEIDVSLLEKFENQRRDIGKKGFQLSNELVKLSKQMVSMVKAGKAEEVTTIKERMLAVWKEMGTADLPRDLAWQFDSEAGAEMVEAFLVADLYPLLFPKNDGKEIKLPSHEDLNVSAPAWLAGIGDAISELGKIHVGLLLDPRLSFGERIAQRQQYLKVAGEMYGFLDQYETCYGMVINHTRRGSFGQSYRGMLFRLAMLIQRENEDLARALDFQAALQDLQAK